MNDIKKDENRHQIPRVLLCSVLIMLFCDILAGQEKYVVTAIRLNVRKQPSAESAVIGGLSKGDIINVRTMKNLWVEIDFNQGVGYVSKKHIEPIRFMPVVELEPQVTVDTIPTEITMENTDLMTDKRRKPFFNSFFNQSHLRLTLTASLGLSNFYSFDAYSSPRFSFGLDVGAQLTIDCMPKNMFSEVTLGYISLGNSKYSFPSFSFNFLPVGYRSDSFNFWVFHETRYYAVGGLSFQFSGGGIFFSRNSQYYSFYSKPTVNFYVKGGLELSDMLGVGFIYMHGFDNVCRSLPIGIKHSVFQLYGSFLFDKWKKK